MKKTWFRKEGLPILARRLIQFGIELPESLMQASLQKWLQFLVMRLYAFPRYFSPRFSITTLTSPSLISVHPIKIDFLNLNPSQILGSPSKIPVVGYSWAPNAYSTPWTAQFSKKQGNQIKKQRNLKPSSK